MMMNFIVFSEILYSSNILYSSFLTNLSEIRAIGILAERRNSRKLSNYNLWVAYIVYLTFHPFEREFSNKRGRSIKMLIN